MKFFKYSVQALNISNGYWDRLKRSYYLFHPVLFASYPVLILYFKNYENISINDIIISQVFIFTVALLLWIILLKVLKSEIKASLVTSIIVLTVFSFGAFTVLLGNIVISGLVITQNRHLIIIYLAVFLVTLLYIIISKRRFVALSKLFLIIACIVHILNIANFFVYERIPNKKMITKEGTLKETGNDLKEKLSRPDIYYIILDGYASAATLKRIFNYDNKEFLDYLETKGFYIASNSHSNYAFTTLSLTSSLSMDYFNIPPNIINMDKNEILRKQENELLKFVQARSYKYISLGTIYRQKETHQKLDPFSYHQLSSYFSMIMLRQTIFDPFLSRWGFYDEYARQAIFNILDKLTTSKDITGPKFVFAHVLCPHPPYVFGPNGEKVKISVESNFSLYKTPWDNKEGYLNQIKFINKKIKLVLDNLLVAGSSNQPVVIIQGDHGPVFDQFQAKDKYYYETRTSILNAYYLPDGGVKYLYSSITPVNTFRIVFNYYFNSNYNLLPDRSFVSDYSKPFDYEFVIDNSEAEHKKN